MTDDKRIVDIINEYHRLLGIRHRLKYPSKNPKVKLSERLRKLRLLFLEFKIKTLLNKKVRLLK